MPCRAFFRSVGLFLFVGVRSCMRFLFSFVLRRFWGVVGGVFGSALRFACCFLFCYAL